MLQIYRWHKPNCNGHGCGLHQLLSGSSEEVQRWRSLNSHFVVGCIIDVFGGTSEGFQRCCFKHHARRGCEGHHHRSCTTHRCERGTKTLVRLIGRHLVTHRQVCVHIYGTLPHPRMQSVSDYRRSFSSNLQQWREVFSLVHSTLMLKLPVWFTRIGPALD